MHCPHSGRPSLSSCRWEGNCDNRVASTGTQCGSADVGSRTQSRCFGAVWSAQQPSVGTFIAQPRLPAVNTTQLVSASDMCSPTTADRLLHVPTPSVQHLSVNKPPHSASRASVEELNCSLTTRAKHVQSTAAATQPVQHTSADKRRCCEHLSSHTQHHTHPTSLHTSSCPVATTPEPPPSAQRADSTKWSTPWRPSPKLEQQSVS